MKLMCVSAFLDVCMHVYLSVTKCMSVHLCVYVEGAPLLLVKVCHGHDHTVTGYLF